MNESQLEKTVMRDNGRTIGAEDNFPKIITEWRLYTMNGTREGLTCTFLKPNYFIYLEKENIAITYHPKQGAEPFFERMTIQKGYLQK